MKKSLIALILALIVFTSQAHAFIDYDDTAIYNPNTQFTPENAEHYSFIPMFREEIKGLEGLTVFDVEDLRALKKKGKMRLSSFDSRFNFDFPVYIEHSKEDYGLDVGELGEQFYCYWKTRGNKSWLTVCYLYVTSNSLALLDKEMTHGLMHISIGAKYGRTPESSKDHLYRPEEQIPQVNDVLRTLELKYKLGVSLERLNKYGEMRIQMRRANFDIDDPNAFHWEMALLLFNKYVDERA